MLMHTQWPWLGSSTEGKKRTAGVGLLSWIQVSKWPRNIVASRAWMASKTALNFAPGPSEESGTESLNAAPTACAAQEKSGTEFGGK